MAGADEAMPVDITANALGVEGSEAVELARDVAAMSQLDMCRWRWLATAAPRETWRRDDEAKACENLATESCRVTFGLSVAGVSMPSLSLRVVADDTAEAEMHAPRSSLESRNTIASSSAETLASAHAFSTPATSPRAHGHGQSQSSNDADHHTGRPRRAAPTADWTGVAEHTSLDTIDESDKATFPRRTRKQLVLNRRHHCRRCAGIFCEQHSSHRATLLMERGSEVSVPVTPGPVEGITAWWRSLPPAIAAMGSILSGVPREATTVPASPISPLPSSILEHRDRPLLERRGRSATCGNVTAEVASASFVKNPHVPRNDAGTTTAPVEQEESEVRAVSEPVASNLKIGIDEVRGREAQSLPRNPRPSGAFHQRRRSASLARLNELMERGSAAAKELPDEQGMKPTVLQPVMSPRSSSTHRLLSSSPGSTNAPTASIKSKEHIQPGFIAFRARVCDQCWLLLERAKRGMDTVPRLSFNAGDLGVGVGASKAPSLASSTSSLPRAPSSSSLAALGASSTTSRLGHRSFSRSKSLADEVDDEEMEHILSVRRVRDEKRREMKHFRRSLKQTVEARLRDCATGSGAQSSREPSPDGRMARARARRRRDEEQRAMDDVSHRMAILAAGPRDRRDDTDGTGSSSEESEDEVEGPAEAVDRATCERRTDRSRSTADDWRMPRKMAQSSSRTVTRDDPSAANSTGHHRIPHHVSPVSSPSPSRSRPGRRLGVGAPQSEESGSSEPKSPAPTPGLMGRERLRRAFAYQIKNAS